MSDRKSRKWPTIIIMTLAVVAVTVVAAHKTAVQAVQA